MKILIVEGIATSGKSTVINKLTEQLSNYEVLVVSEAETHIPIMEQPAGIHIKHFEKLLNEKLTGNPDLIIFDRLYLTQAFRANVSLDAYKSIEDALSELDCLTVYLK